MSACFVLSIDEDYEDKERCVNIQEEDDSGNGRCAFLQLCCRCEVAQ